MRWKVVDVLKLHTGVLKCGLAKTWSSTSDFFRDKKLFGRQNRNYDLKNLKILWISNTLSTFLKFCCLCIHCLNVKIQLLNHQRFPGLNEISSVRLQKAFALQRNGNKVELTNKRSWTPSWLIHLTTFYQYTLLVWAFIPHFTFLRIKRTKFEHGNLQLHFYHVSFFISLIMFYLYGSTSSKTGWRWYFSCSKTKMRRALNKSASRLISKLYNFGWFYYPHISF